MPKFRRPNSKTVSTLSPPRKKSFLDTISLRLPGQARLWVLRSPFSGGGYRRRIWVVFGSIFIGAVHDFGALVISLRNRGQTVGEVAGRLISPRARLLFLLILFAALTVVLAIFGLVIATIFAQYPESVLSVWIEIPIAVLIGYHVYKRGGGLLIPSLVALGVLYLCIYIGVYHFEIKPFGENAIVVWTLILMAYCFIASILPVWTLLQPRDYINSHQLMVALALLVGGLLVACVSGKADLFASRSTCR